MCTILRANHIKPHPKKKDGSLHQKFYWEAPKRNMTSYSNHQLFFSAARFVNISRFCVASPCFHPIILGFPRVGVAQIASGADHSTYLDFYGHSSCRREGGWTRIWLWKVVNWGCWKSWNRQNVSFTNWDDKLISFVHGLYDKRYFHLNRPLLLILADQPSDWLGESCSCIPGRGWNKHVLMYTSLPVDRFASIDTCFQTEQGTVMVCKACITCTSTCFKRVVTIP